MEDPGGDTTDPARHTQAMQAVLSLAKGAKGISPEDLLAKGP